ncbi:MAG: PAS domain-containing sensor histidine kinase [Rhodocyclales bacterium]|nr:PAS domain-containing sensor histidine kinase [Rhodocyclales bacterium]
MTSYPAPDPLRLAPLRYFNVFRLIVAGVFLVLGREINLGNDGPHVFIGAVLAYLGCVLALGFPDAIRRVGFDRLVTLLVVLDIFMLATVMIVSGGFRSGMPVLMLVFLAAAGLVAVGRMVFFFAALASVVVLIENAVRTYAGGNSAEFLQVGFTCMGFFAVAFTARLLAKRATESEYLADQRGEALGRQQAINERIIEDMQDGVVVMGGDGRLRQANPHATVLLGMDLVEGMPLTDVDPLFGECHLRCSGAHGMLLRLGPANRMLRCRAVRASTSGAMEGDTLLYLTDFEEIQKQIQQHKLAALGRLTASMAHEIRNPLSAVTQAADLLGEEKRTDVQARLVRIINDNARRIERMVREVLALGRRDNLMREALPLAGFVADMVEESALRDAGVKALFSVNIGSDATMAIDRAHLHQILGNLLTNARRYCSGRPGAIKVYVTHVGRDRIALHVRDDGPGVAAEERMHIFEPFYTTDPKGIGLGMYIGRELAEANDASLELLDEGPGAHFVLTGRSQP